MCKRLSFLRDKKELSQFFQEDIHALEELINQQRGMMLPNFYALELKSGTTSLYDILKQHKDVFPIIQRATFFDLMKVGIKGSHGILSSYYAKANQAGFTPTYLSNNLAPARIQEVLK